MAVQAMQAQWGNLQQGAWLRAFPPMPLGLAPGGPLQLPPQGPLQGQASGHRSAPNHMACMLTHCQALDNLKMFEMVLPA